MNSRSPSNPPTPPQPIEVDLTWIAGRMEHRIVFGRSIAERTTEPRTARSDLCSRQHLCRHAVGGQRFWPHRCEAGDFAGAEARRAAERGFPSCIPPWRSCCAPPDGPTCNVQSESSTQCRRPRSIPPMWRLIIGCMSATGWRPAEHPRPYTRARHLAWLLRRRISQ